MDYTIKLSLAMHGDVVPLTKVADAMAMRKTIGGGAIPWHKGTYLSMKQQYEGVLLDAVTKNALVACDQFGKVGTADEIVDADLMARKSPEYPEIYSLYAKEYHLNQWAATNGDAFTLKDTGVEVIETAIGVITLESLPAQTPATAAPVVAGQAEAGEPASDGTAPPNKTIHSTKTRRDTLTPVIELAQKNCIDPKDTAAVWGALLVLANNKHAPLLRTEENGIAYLRRDGVKTFTSDALNKRLHPEKRGAPGKRR